MTDEIYILRNDGQLEAMLEQKFDLEDVLQQLVADHPELLSAHKTPMAVCVGLGQKAYICPTTSQRWFCLPSN